MENLLINRSKLTEIRIVIAVTAATLWRFRAFPLWRDVIADPSIVATLTAGPRSISLSEPVVGAASNTDRIVVAWGLPLRHATTTPKRWLWLTGSGPRSGFVLHHIC